MYPLVSIIIPVYNTEKYLRTCLDSALNQIYPNIEIIVINDCSTDHSQAIIDYYFSMNNNIKVVDSKKRLFPGGARNVGLDLSQGEYIYFLDSDDFIPNDAISSLVHLALFYDAAIVSANHQTIIDPFKSRDNRSFGNSFIDLRYHKEMIDDCNGVVWNNLYKHELVEMLRFPEGVFYEDNAFIYPIFTKADSWVKTDSVLYFYRRNLQSITIKSKLFPNERILDVYTVLNSMKDACIDLGTYEEYREVINKISQRIAIYPLLECSIWFGISKSDRTTILNLLLQYIKNTYGIENIKQVEYLIKRIDNNNRLKIKLEFLLKQIDKLPALSETDINLDSVKRILKKYS